MAGKNRANLSVKFARRSELLARGIKCVFISHQKRDREEAKKVADYLLTAGVDVYFDEYDQDLRIHNETDNPRGVTAAICLGINNSSHMLVLVSPHTVGSSWVPFEIGYGFEKTDLAVLTLGGIPKGALPAYVRTAKVIRDIADLNGFIGKLAGQEVHFLQVTKQLHRHDDLYNPLRGVMDGYVSDNY